MACPPAILSVPVGNGILPVLRGLVYRAVHREPEHRGHARRERLLDAFQDFRRRELGRVVPEVLDALEVLREGVAERVRLAVELRGGVRVRPVLLRRHPEEHQGAHGRPYERPAVTLELRQVPGGLVQEQPRCVQVLPEGLLLAALGHAHARVRGARAYRPLVLYRRAPSPQVRLRPGAPPWAPSRGPWAPRAPGCPSCSAAPCS